MKPLTCAATRRRLHAYHDRELPISDQIAVASHLDWCGECAGRAADLRFLRTAVQAAARARNVQPAMDLSGFTATVVNRLKAEREASLPARVRLMFDDMHLVYAGLGAAAATLVCLIVMLGMMHFGATERPDSLAALINVVGVPLECETPATFADQTGCLQRMAERFQEANASAEQDAVFALDSAVTHRSGRLANLQSLKAHDRVSASGTDLDELLDAACRARLEMQPLGVSTATSLIRLVPRKTARVSKSQLGDLPLPTASRKKQTA
jgi:hypothetical protein